MSCYLFSLCPCFVCVCLFYGVLMVFLFFFFKQKTAYEMRISDWSSDVCSSDLFCRAPRPSSLSPLNRKRRLPCALCPDAAAHPIPTLQIGRASCRERVCQYV